MCVGVCVCVCAYAASSWATETVLSPWLVADEDRVSHVLSHVVWWKKFFLIYISFTYAASHYSLKTVEYIFLETLSEDVRVFLLFSLCLGRGGEESATY